MLFPFCDDRRSSIRLNYLLLGDQVRGAERTSPTYSGASPIIFIELCVRLGNTLCYMREILDRLIPKFRGCEMESPS